MDYAKIVKAILSPERYHHSVCVAKQAEHLAHCFGADPAKAHKAGLLHDICKEMPQEEQLKYLKAHDILLDAQTLDNPPVWHGITASVYLRVELGLQDPEILSAVRCHSTGKKAMTPLEEVVFIADYTSGDRDYPEMKRIQELLPEHKNRVILEGIAFGLQTALKKRRGLIVDGLEAYEYYLSKMKQEEAQ